MSGPDIPKLVAIVRELNSLPHTEDVINRRNVVYRLACPVLAEECDRLKSENERLRAALNRDKTGLGAALNEIRVEVRGRSWMAPDGNWASYSYEDHNTETLRKEIGWAFDAIEKIAADALSASGKLAHETLTEAHVPVSQPK